MEKTLIAVGRPSPCHPKASRKSARAHEAMDTFPWFTFYAGIPSGRLDVYVSGCHDAGVEP